MSVQAIGSGKKSPGTPPGVTTFLAGKTAQEWFAGISFVTPALIVVFVFIVVPMLFAFWISFTNWTGLQPPENAQSVGTANYQALLGLGENAGGISQEEFFVSIKNTTYYVLGVVPCQTILALVLAMIVNQKFLKGKGFFRTAFYFPAITSSVVISTIFKWLFNRQGVINITMGNVAELFGGSYRYVNWLENPDGLIHNLFKLFGLTIRNAPDWMKTELLGQTLWQWLSGPSVTMSGIMLLNIWTTSGTLMLIYLAALQDIPGQLYEAASVDGATRWQQFRQITLPLLRPTSFFIITIGLIGTFQVFDQIFVISSGGPAKTTFTIAWMVYRNAFLNSQAGLGAATAFLLFMLIGVFTLLQRRLIGTSANT